MKILVIGASGFLGRKTYSSFAFLGDNKVVGTCFTHVYPYLQKLDIKDAQAVNDLFGREKPELVIHVAGIGRPSQTEKDIDLAYDVNAEGTRNIVNASKKSSSILVYFSSSFVFDGKKQGPYTENDKVNPVNVYEKTKVEAESFINDFPKSIIFRTDMIYGYNGKGMNNGLFGMIGKEKPSLSLNAFNIRQPLFVEDIKPAIDLLLRNQLFGTFNLACDEYITQYDLGSKLEKIIRKRSLIQPYNQAAAGRPLNVLLDTTKVRNLGIKFKSIKESLHIITRQFGMDLSGVDASFTKI